MDSTEIAALYRLEAPQLAAYVRRLVGDADAAMDIVQETFRVLVQQANRTHLQSPRAWLYAVARHLAAKSQRRFRPLPLRDELPVAAPPEPDERIQMMRQAIARLPPELREALELRLEHELSYQEIAFVLGIPLGTVRSRLHNAVRALRKRLGGQESQRWT